MNSHCNNNDKKEYLKKLQLAGREPTVHRLKDHRAPHYATEFDAKNR